MATPIIDRLRSSATILTTWENFIAPFYKSGSPGSFGRLWASILIAVCLCRFWVIKLDPPETMITVLLAMLSYVFLTKGVEIVRSKTGATKITNTADVAQPAVTPPAQTGDGPNV